MNYKKIFLILIILISFFIFEKAAAISPWYRVNYSISCPNAGHCTETTCLWSREGCPIYTYFISKKADPTMSSGISFASLSEAGYDWKNCIIGLRRINALGNPEYIYKSMLGHDVSQGWIDSQSGILDLSKYGINYNSYILGIIDKFNQSAQGTNNKNCNEVPLDKDQYTAIKSMSNTCKANEVVVSCKKTQTASSPPVVKESPSMPQTTTQVSNNWQSIDANIGKIKSILNQNKILTITAKNNLNLGQSIDVTILGINKTEIKNIETITFINPITNARETSKIHNDSFHIFNWGFVDQIIINQ